MRPLLPLWQIATLLWTTIPFPTVQGTTYPHPQHILHDNNNNNNNNNKHYTHEKSWEKERDSQYTDQHHHGIVPNDSNGSNASNGISKATREKLLALHKDLIDIESNTYHEQQVGNMLADYLTQHNLTVEKLWVDDTRFNVLAYPGSSNKTDILITSHIDTVSNLHTCVFVDGRGDSWIHSTDDMYACE